MTIEVEERYKPCDCWCFCAYPLAKGQNYQCADCYEGRHMNQMGFRTELETEDGQLR